MEAAKKDRQDKKRVLTTRINALNRYVAENRDVDHVKVKVEELKESFDKYEIAPQVFAPLICLASPNIRQYYQRIMP